MFVQCVIYSVKLFYVKKMRKLYRGEGESGIFRRVMGFSVV